MYESTYESADAPQTETNTSEQNNDHDAAGTVSAPLTNTGTADVPDANPNLLNAPLKSLRERGISAETKKHFGIRDFAGVGLVYKTTYLTGEAGPTRFKGMFPGQLRFGWLGDAENAQLPPVYNGEALRDAERTKNGIFVVQGEADAWVAHQAGLAAVALVGDSNSSLEGLAEVAKELGTYLYCETTHREVQLLFDNDAVGRRWALQVSQSLRECDIRCHVLSLGSYDDAPLGFSVTDLFERVGFDAAKFREAVGMLPLVSRSMLQSWEDDPTVDLPPAKNEADELYPCLNETDLAELPEAECVVDDVLLSSGVTLMTGKENLGKSAIAIALGASISLGIPWNGQATKAGLVYYIAAEGARGIHKRLNAWKKTTGIESTPRFIVLPMSVPLHDPVARDRLIRTIEHHAAKCKYRSNNRPCHRSKSRPLVV